MNVINIDVLCRPQIDYKQAQQVLRVAGFVGLLYGSLAWCCRNTTPVHSSNLSLNPVVTQCQVEDVQQVTCTCCTCTAKRAANITQVGTANKTVYADAQRT